MFNIFINCVQRALNSCNTLFGNMGVHFCCFAVRVAYQHLPAVIEIQANAVVIVMLKNFYFDGSGHFKFLRSVKVEKNSAMVDVWDEI